MAGHGVCTQRLEGDMPQVIVLLLAGVGLYAGYRWVMREVRRAMVAAQEAEEQLRRRAEAGAPRDLGKLEWDEEARVYRPAKRG